jgi:hypothetical protein
MQPRDAERSECFPGASNDPRSGEPRTLQGFRRVGTCRLPLRGPRRGPLRETAWGGAGPRRGRDASTPGLQAGTASRFVAGRRRVGQACRAVTGQAQRACGMQPRDAERSECFPGASNDPRSGEPRTLQGFRRVGTCRLPLTGPRRGPLRETAWGGRRPQARPLRVQVWAASRNRVAVRGISSSSRSAKAGFFKLRGCRLDKK